MDKDIIDFKRLHFLTILMYLDREGGSRVPVDFNRVANLNSTEQKIFVSHLCPRLYAYRMITDLMVTNPDVACITAAAAATEMKIAHGLGS